MPVLLLAIVLSLLVGVVSASGSILLSGMVAGVVGVLAVMGSPRLLFWTTLTGSLLVAGLLELYLPALQFARWIFPLSAGLFLVAVGVARLWSPTPLPPSSARGLTLAAYAFVTVSLLSILLNWQGPTSAVAGLKNYFQAWGMLFGLALMGFWAGLERQVAKALLVIGLIQLPFAVHQFLFIAPLRGGVGVVPVDVVAGTFGASFDGGGNNAVLALFVVCVAAVMLALWRHKALRGRSLLLALPVLLAPIFMNESKVSVVYMALAFLIVFRREIVERPLRFIALAGVIAVMVVGLVLSYAALHKSSRATNATELIEEVIRQNTQDGERYGLQDLNRTTALTHWASEQRHYPLTKTLFGHGPTAAKRPSGVLDSADSLAARRYPGMGIGVTAVSAMLWEVGVVGLAAALALVASAFVTAGRLARANASDAFLAGLFEGLQAAVALVGLSLFHKSFFTFQLGYQVLLALLLGLLLYASRHLTPTAAAARARQQAPSRR